MKTKLYKAALIVSAVLLAIFVYFFISKDLESGGAFLISGLVFLAVGVRKHAFFKGFSYTILIFASVSIALCYPEYFIELGSFQLKGLIIPLLQIIMFGMGSQMSLQDFKGVIQSPKAVVIGVLCQFTIMPMVALSLITLFNFPAEIAAGIILVGASPSGLASNVMSFLAKANVALSVTLTAVATVLAPLLTPLIMKGLADQLIPINFWSMMLGIMNIVILPIVAGLLFNLFAFGNESSKNKTFQILGFFAIIILKNIIFIVTEGGDMSGVMLNLLSDLLWFMALPIASGIVFRKMFGTNKVLMEQVLSLVSMIGIGVIITIITAAGRDNLLEIGALLILACFIHNMLGYGLGYWACKLMGLDQKSCRTIALEVGMQNGGLASGIALQMGKVATVGLAPSVFGPLMNITGSSLATWWRGKPTDEE
ncbi:MAG: bile acid:sodium symporter family protein [Cyclobacteriaceae bacterium]